MSSLLWRATNLKLSELPVGSSPVPVGARERGLILPVTGIDGKWWVMHTEQMICEGSLRVRHTSQDNSPQGREVHWSSVLMWFLTGGAWIIHFFSGTPILDCVPIAAMYSGPVLLLILLSIYTAVLQRRYGWTSAGTGVLFFATCFPVFELFRVGNCDHHGLVGWFATMSLLCLAAGGGGCVALPKSKDCGGMAPLDSCGELLMEERAGRWFIAAGSLGAAGLWVSAATQIPIMVGTAAGASLVGWFCRRAEFFRMAPRLWKVWGRAGCMASLFFYLLEYFPTHMGWRLEVNHPLYALAWLGGGEMIARSLSKMSGGPFVRKDWRDRAGAATSLLLILLPAMVIAWKKADVFWVSDRFLLALHNEHIGEFQPFFEAIEGPTMGIIFIQALILPAIGMLALVVLAVRRTVPPSWIAPLVIVFVPSLFMLALGMKQVRWVGISLCLWALLLTLLAAMICSRGPTTLFRRWQFGILAGMTLLAVSILPFIAMKNWLQMEVREKRIPKGLLPNVVARDVVQRILRANPSQMPVILCGPTTSTDVAYYGGTKMIGTLYWENTHGLKAAADIFSAPDSETARKKLAERGITHILLFSWDEFSKDYSELWGREAPERPVGKIFATRLLEGSEMPQWVRPLFYPIPPAFELVGESVSLFEIVPEQSRSDSLAAQAIYRLDAGQYESALALLQTARSEFPGDRRFSELLATAEKAAAIAKQPAPSAPGTSNPPVHR